MLVNTKHPPIQFPCLIPTLRNSHWCSPQLWMFTIQLAVSDVCSWQIMLKNPMWIIGLGHNTTLITGYYRRHLGFFTHGNLVTTCRVVISYHGEMYGNLLYRINNVDLINYYYIRHISHIVNRGRSRIISFLQPGLLFPWNAVFLQKSFKKKKKLLMNSTFKEGGREKEGIIY